MDQREARWLRALYEEALPNLTKLRKGQIIRALENAGYLKIRDDLLAVSFHSSVGHRAFRYTITYLDAADTPAEGSVWVSVREDGSIVAKF